LFARLTTCSGSNLGTNYHLYQFGYLIFALPGPKLIEMSKFPIEIIQTLKTLNE